LDQGVIRQSDSGVSFSKISSNSGSTSTLGFRGLEDLGGGNTAGFHLLSELSLPEGQVGSANSGAASTTGQKPNFFTRAANVYLSNKDLGTVEIGRLQDIVWQYQGTFNNTNINSFGWNTATSVLTNTGVSGALGNFNRGVSTGYGSVTPTPFTTGVNQSSIGNAAINFAAGWSYIAPKLFNNTTTLTYQKIGNNFTGQTASVTGTGVTYSDNAYAGEGQAFGAAYENGPLAVRYAQTTRNGTTNSTGIKNVTYGATYQMGAYKFVAAQTQDTFSGSFVVGTAFPNAKATGLGVMYDLNATVDLALGYTTMSDSATADASKSKILGLTGRYKFTKRTMAYAGYGHGSNSGANNYQSVFYGGPGVTGGAASSVTGYIVGVRHSF
jgi:predicted porin